MNTMLKTLQFCTETTETLCHIHNTPLMKIANYKLCKLCAKETVHHSHAIYADELQQRLLQQKIKNSGLNKRYLDRGFKNYVVASPAQDHAIKLCQTFAQQIISEHYPNLLLIGTPGTGKTHLSAAIIRNILHNSTKSARYYTSAAIAQKMMDTWSDTSHSEKEVIEHFSSFDLLVIDEYGLHDRHEKRREMVHKVLYSRYDNMKSTLLISNFTLQNIQQDLDVRLWSRLHENNLIVVPCYWDDQRISRSV
ncbi:ATP-binding protein [Acinetobacter wuhouensis]|uniref:AAA family ATPase n=1 Tax=Acinetobacter wuhouensis TaxID=1879050 RepID=A0A4Q7AEM0_9GAMM|nr:ATP-binding protein [Acinetobacter wuhouensis]RZG45323.1 AAA family ATPase [Acinetobacter wuhouensis]